MRCTKNLTGNIYFHWDYGTTDESQADIIASDSPAHSILDPLRPRLQFLISRPQINADDWTLIIAKTGLLDGGRYECSVNTLPKISHTVELRVEEEKEHDLELALADSPVLETWDPLERLEARIQGPKTQYVSEGSTVALQCRSVMLYKQGSVCTSVNHIF